MAKQKTAIQEKVEALKSAFVNEDDIAIEKATRLNIKRIDDSNIEKIHRKLIDVLEIKSEEDSRYFKIKNFRKLIEDIRRDREEKAKAKQQKEEAEAFAGFEQQN